ncbi:hypothetical protein BSKO_05989 [Bryopsis sp. KO-2023]|nr:hypothetical protein BSKO_05989 [Bryopsis sp. KO-2023]
MISSTLADPFVHLPTAFNPVQILHQLFNLPSPLSRAWNIPGFGPETDHLDCTGQKKKKISFHINTDSVSRRLGSHSRQAKIVHPRVGGNQHDENC